MAARNAFDSALIETVKAGGIEGVILMSPRTAEIFVAICRHHDLFDYARPIYYFCLAESVAKRLEPLAPARVLVAGKPNRAALLALLAAPPLPGHDSVQCGS
jgi:uroporphyrinogen-III synthase